MEITQKARSATNLLSPQEAADILGTTVGVLAVWRTTKRYPLAYAKIGRKVMYRPEAVQSFIESRTISPMEA